MTDRHVVAQAKGPKCILCKQRPSLDYTAREFVTVRIPEGVEHAGKRTTICKGCVEKMFQDRVDEARAKVPHNTGTTNHG